MVPVGQLLSAKLPEKGLIGLAFWDAGARNVTNSKRPITKGEDLDGLKLRVPRSPCSSRRFAPSRHAPSGSRSRISTRALRTGPSTVRRARLHHPLDEVLRGAEVPERDQPRVPERSVVLVSKRFWDRLSPAEQRIFQEAANESRAYQRSVSREADQKALNELRTRHAVQRAVPARAATHANRRGFRLQQAVASVRPALVTTFRSELARIQKVDLPGATTHR